MSRRHGRPWNGSKHSVRRDGMTHLICGICRAEGPPHASNVEARKHLADDGWSRCYTGSEDQLRCSDCRAARPPGSNQHPRRTTPVTDPMTRDEQLALADRLDARADWTVGGEDLHAAADGLRRLAAITTAIGEMAWVIDPEHGLTEPAVVMVRLDREELDDLRRIAAAASLTPTPTPDHDGHTIDVGPVTVHDDVSGYVPSNRIPERDRLADENRALREQLEEAQLRSIEARNPGIDMDEVRASRAAAADRGVTDGDRNEGERT